METRLPLSAVLGRPVSGPSGAVLGRLRDVVVRLVEQGLPTVTGVLLHLGERDVFVSIGGVASLEANGLRLTADQVDPRPFERRPGEVLLQRDVCGRAVVDVARARLLRVGDLVLERTDAQWRLAAVRAAPPSAVSRLARRVLGRPAQREEVSWRQIVPLVGHVPTAARGLTLRGLTKLKPAAIADIVEAASHAEGEQILDVVGRDEALEADVFEELDEANRLEFLQDRSDGEAAEVMAHMEPDPAADLLQQLPQERRQPVLAHLPAEQQAKVRALLRYGPETAGGLMNTDFVALAPEQTAASALDALRALPEAPTILTDVFVVEDGRLLGSLTLRDLIRADPAAPLRALLRGEPEPVYADADLPSIAVHMADYNLAALPVLDEAGRLIGIVTYDDLVEAMLPAAWRWRGPPAAPPSLAT